MRTFSIALLTATFLAAPIFSVQGMNEEQDEHGVIPRGVGGGYGTGAGTGTGGYGGAPYYGGYGTGTGTGTGGE